MLIMACPKTIVSLALLAVFLKFASAQTPTTTAAATTTTATTKAGGTPAPQSAATTAAGGTPPGEPTTVAGARQRSWLDVVLYATNAVVDCHERCKGSLAEIMRIPVKECGLRLSAELYLALNLCLKANNFPLNDDTPCWRTSTLLRTRRSVEVTDKLVAQLDEYNGCFNSCKRTSEVLQDAGCKPLADSKLQHIVDVCTDDVFGLKAAEIGARIYVPCMLNIVLGK